MFTAVALCVLMLLPLAVDLLGAGSLADKSAAAAAGNAHFRKVVLATNLDEPIQLSVAMDGRVYFGERHGAVKVWRPDTRETSAVGLLNVFNGPEDGLLGLALDPGFLTNRRIEWERSWIRTVRLSPEGRLEKIDPFLPRMKIKRPISMSFGPDGALYLIEWGSAWYNNKDAQVVRIEHIR